MPALRTPKLIQRYVVDRLMRNTTATSSRVKNVGGWVDGVMRLRFESLAAFYGVQLGRSGANRWILRYIFDCHHEVSSLKDLSFHACEAL